ncbi:MAG: preprotein translocase subunit SecA [Rhodothermales bacterium]|jgi:preprotein translocase subunit SecA
MGLFSRILGSADSRALKKLGPVLDSVRAQEAAFHKLSASAIRSRVAGVPSLASAFAAVSLCEIRNAQPTPPDWQIQLAILLDQPQVVEPPPGENLSVPIAMALYRSCLSGQRCVYMAPDDEQVEQEMARSGAILQSLGVTVAHARENPDCQVVYSGFEELDRIDDERFVLVNAAGFPLIHYRNDTFRRFRKLAGIACSVDDTAAEYQAIFGLKVSVVPSPQPCQRKYLDDRIFDSHEPRIAAIATDVGERRKRGQPVIIGASQAMAELIAELIPDCQVAAGPNAMQTLNRAGNIGAVTLLTPPSGFDARIPLGPGVTKRGGLCVIGAERDIQMDGFLTRCCARRGEPGVVQFYLSLDDELMTAFGSERIRSQWRAMGMKDGEALCHPWLNKSIKKAQTRLSAELLKLRKMSLGLK